MFTFSRRSPFFVFLTCLLCLSFLAQDAALARGGGGGSRGGGGGSRSGGTSRGASPRVNSNVNLQNRGNVSGSSNRQTNSSNRANNQGNRTDNRANNQGNRQDNRADNQGNRQDNQGNRQDNRADNQGNRQDNRTDRQGTRQEQTTERQSNRQDFVDDNYYGGWRGGGWYGGGYGVPPGWGWAALTTGLIIGAAIASLPPYYNTVYVGSTTYIYSDGVYMQPSNDEYIIVAPPAGAVVTYLPDGCTTQQTNNVVYYSCSGIYYQPVAQNGSTVYKVVQL